MSVRRPRIRRRAALAMICSHRLRRYPWPSSWFAWWKHHGAQMEFDDVGCELCFSVCQCCRRAVYTTTSRRATSGSGTRRSTSQGTLRHAGCPSTMAADVVQGDGQAGFPWKRVPTPGSPSKPERELKVITHVDDLLCAEPTDLRWFRKALGEIFDIRGQCTG